MIIIPLLITKAVALNTTSHESPYVKDSHDRPATISDQHVFLLTDLVFGDDPDSFFSLPQVSSFDDGHGLNPDRSAVRASTFNFPGNVIDLNIWSLTLPTGATGNPTIIRNPILLSYSNTLSFYVNPQKAIVFRANAGGTTDLSMYPRSELSEMKGAAKASWSCTSNLHRMKWSGLVNRVCPVKREVVLAEIFGQITDVIQIKYTGTTAATGRISVFSKNINYDSNYQLGTKYNMKLVATKGVIYVFYNDFQNPKVLIPCKSSGNSFRLGAVTLSNPGKGDAPGSYSEVWLYSAVIEHSISTSTTSKLPVEASTIFPRLIIRNVLVFSANSEDSVSGCANALAALMQTDNWSVNYASYGELSAALSSNKYSMIAFPGADGECTQYVKKFTSSDISSVRTFVNNGGFFLGICMGAAIAIMGTDINGFGMTCNVPGLGCTLNFDSIYGSAPGNQAVTLADGLKYHVYIEDPPNFGKLKDGSGVTILGTYESTSTTAMFMQSFGKGAYAITSFHPEADRSWGGGIKDSSAFKAGIYMVHKLIGEL